MLFSVSTTSTIRLLTECVHLHHANISFSVCPDLQSKAAELNQTLSRRDGTPDKSLKEMKEEIQAMLVEMRKRQLGGKKRNAEEEMAYGHTHTQHAHMLCMLSPSCNQLHRF